METKKMSISDNSNQMAKDKLALCQQKIRQAKQVTVLTGAGISAESGIPTFRDKQTGLWENFRAEELASQQGFLANPKLVWQWYQMRRQLIQDKQPNAGHDALFQLEQYCQSQGKAFTLISQNVDELHEKSGSNPIKIHGNIMKNQCNSCLTPYTQDASSNELISCPKCDGLVRPSVVWFGENLPEEAWNQAYEAASQADVFMSIGTSSQVYPAAGLIDMAKSRKKHAVFVIEINPNPTEQTSVDVQFPNQAGKLLPMLINQLTN